MPTIRPGFRGRRGERGFALVVVLATTLLLSAIAGALHIGVLGETRLRGAHARATAGFYAAEAGINRGIGDYRNIFLAYHQPAGSDFDEQTLLLGPRTVRYRLRPACAGGCPLDQQVPAGHPFAGMRAQVYKYVAQATSEVHAGDVETSLGTEFQVNYIPLFQFLAFYDRDLEINPGAPMTLNGPVHTNGSLYLGPSNALAIADAPPLIPSVSVTSAQGLFRGRKDDQQGPKCGGTVHVDKLTDTNLDGSLDARRMDCVGGLLTPQTDEMLAPWLGAIRARQPDVAVPRPDVLDRASGEYWDRADLRLALDLSAPSGGLFPIVVLTQGDDVDDTLTPRLHAFMAANPGAVFYSDAPVAGSDAATTDCSLANTYCNRQSYDPPFAQQNQVYACARSALGLYGACAPVIANVAIAGGVTARRGGFYNNRERAWVYMLNVNAHDLLAWNRAQPAGDRVIADPDDATDGGLVLYLTVKGPASTGVLPANRRYGVRVFGSPSLDFAVAAADPTGLTVVSDQAIYVEGDYNLRAGQPNAIAGNPKQPAAFLGDSINVLSRNWSGPPGAWASGCRNDCQSRRTVTERPAATTYVNAAFLGGVDDTIPGDGQGYNGGLENYPRLHESWSGVTLYYQGSFVSLGTPRRASGRWCGTGAGCNIYTPPGRTWNYDPDFQQVANLPPLTPRAVSVEQILFTENFR